MKAMEIELQDKEKVDRGVLNSWYLEIQRLKVRKIIKFLLKMSIFVFFLIN